MNISICGYLCIRLEHLKNWIIKVLSKLSILEKVLNVQIISFWKYADLWAVGVAQLVEWLLPTTEVHGSNPAIGKIYIEYFLSNVVKRRQ